MRKEEILKEFREEISNPKDLSHSLWLISEAIAFTLEKERQKVKETIEKCIIETKEDKVINIAMAPDESKVLSVDLLKFKKELEIE